MFFTAESHCKHINKGANQLLIQWQQLKLQQRLRKERDALSRRKAAQQVKTDENCKVLLFFCFNLIVLLLFFILKSIPSFISCAPAGDQLVSFAGGVVVRDGWKNDGKVMDRWMDGTNILLEVLNVLLPFSTVLHSVASSWTDWLAINAHVKVEMKLQKWSYRLFVPAAYSNDSSDQYFIQLNTATLISRDKTCCFYQCCPMTAMCSCMFLRSGSSLHVKCFHYANILT